MAHAEAAVDRQHGTGDVGRIGGGEECHRRGHLVRRGVPPQRHAGQDPAAFLGHQQRVEGTETGTAMNASSSRTPSVTARRMSNSSQKKRPLSGARSSTGSSNGIAIR